VADELRILIIEDVAADVVMINHELRKGGVPFRTKRVDSKAAFLHELQHNPPDLILSDHGLPGFDGFSALAIAKDKYPDIPFVFVTGSMGEEVAVETLKSGATDYVLKNRLSANLLPAIHRALREAGERRKRKQAEQALHESEERFRLLVEGVKDYALCMLDPEGRVMNWNAGAELIMGYSTGEIVGQHFSRFYTQEDLAAAKPAQALHMARAEGRFEEEGWRQRKSGARFIAHLVINALRDQTGRLRGFAHVIRDITAIKQAQEALQQSWARQQQLVELFPDAVMVQANGGIVFANEAAIRLLGATSPEQVVGKSMKDIAHADDWRRLDDHIRRLREEGTAFFLKRRRESPEEQTPAALSETRLIRLDGTAVNVVVVAAPVTFQFRPAVIVFAYNLTGRR
jgi:PAS domain S-box-containing protein